MQYIQRRHVVLFVLAATSGAITKLGFDQASALHLSSFAVSAQQIYLLLVMLGSMVVILVNFYKFRWHEGIDVNSINAFFLGFGFGNAAIVAAGLMQNLGVTMLLVRLLELDNAMLMYLITIALAGVGVGGTYQLTKLIDRDTRFAKFLVWQAACLSVVVAAIAVGGLYVPLLTWLTAGVVISAIGSHYYNVRKGFDRHALFVVIALFTYGGLGLAVSGMLSVVDLSFGLAVSILSAVLLMQGSAVGGALLIRHRLDV